MRVSFLPLYDENGASSRLRVYSLHRELLKLGVDSNIGLTDCDVLVVQKHQSQMALALLKAHKGVSIYDFDDTQEVRGINCSLITTDTEAHRDWALHQQGLLANVIPDPIDFCPGAPCSPSIGNGVVWFGHSSNLTGKTIEWLDALKVEHRITDLSDIRVGRVAFLTHAGQDQGKSNNKMLRAITYGIPVVAAESIAYKELLTTCGLGEFYVETPKEAGARIAYLVNPSNAARYLAQAQSFVWQNYHPSMIAKMWLQMVNNL